MAPGTVRYQPASWNFVIRVDFSPTTFCCKIVEVFKVSLLLFSQLPSVSVNTGKTSLLIFFWVWVGRRPLYLRQYQSPWKRKFASVRVHKTYSMENILYVRPSSSQTMTKCESRIEKNKGCCLQRSRAAWRSYSEDCKVYTLRLGGRQYLWKSASGRLNLDT